MKSFLKYSKEIGNNFLLTQGPGGNTSTKISENIYIKKSGMHLSDSVNNSIFQKVNLNKIISFYETNKNNQKFEEGLSIETPIHVLLDEKHVFHYHSISSLIISAITKKDKLDDFLYKRKIQPINYFRPGYELAKEILKKNNKEEINSFFLYSHGMVVSGNNLRNIRSRIYKIENEFEKLLDYKRLEQLLDLVQINYDTEKKQTFIPNPLPNLNYEVFNNLYFFPDHAVFLPFSFCKDNNLIKKNKNIIFFNKEKLYLNKCLDETEKIYLKVLLTICSYIDSKKIYNVINKKTGDNLRKSDDEILRIRVNK